MTRNRQPHHHSGPLSSSYSCFRPLPSDDNKTHHSSPPPTPTPPPPPLAATANLTTSLYHTRIGMFAVTWSRNFLGRSLRIHLLHHDNNNNNNKNNSNKNNNNNNSNKNNNNNNSNKNNNNNNRRRQTHRSLSLPSSPCVTNSPYSSSSSSSFHLTLKPYLFWNKQGSRKLLIPSIGNATVYWDLTRAKFGSGAPDPDSGFYIAVVIPGGEIALLLGDLDRQAQLRAQARSFKSSSSKSSLPPPGAGQALVVRREHVQQGARKLHRTRAQFGGKSREISIECDDDDRPDPSLVIRVDSTPAVQLKHLRWKFRGSERVEIDGHPLQISWDAHDWLFDAESSNQNSKDGGGGGGGGGFALFTFRFEKRAEECCFGEDYEEGVSTTSSSWTEDELITGVENKEMGKRKRRSLAARKARSCSSSSLSSSAASSSACGSVLEWESVEESDLKGGPTAAFSLVVYAWKS